MNIQKNKQLNRLEFTRGGGGCKIKPLYLLLWLYVTKTIENNKFVTTKLDIPGFEVDDGIRRPTAGESRQYAE